MGWTIAWQRMITRANVSEGGISTFEYVPEPEKYGVHPTRKACIRAFMELWSPELKGYSDEEIARHWQQFARNLKYGKCVKV